MKVKLSLESNAGETLLVAPYEYHGDDEPEALRLYMVAYDAMEAAYGDADDADDEPEPEPAVAAPVQAPEPHKSATAFGRTIAAREHGE